MNPLKKLAGQTAIYGLSTIIGRLLNYLLVPLYTYNFTAAQYGVSTEMYAYSSFLLILLTYGMETALLNFSSSENNKEKVYSTSLISISISSFLFIVLACLFGPSIASLIRYPEHPEYIIWFAFILGFDAMASIVFVRLREQNKARRFAFVKIINILANIGFNVFFIIICSKIYQHPDSPFYGLIEKIYDPEIGIGYAFISNLIASILTLVFLLPEIKAVKYIFDRALWRKMMIYAFPLLIAGLAGMTNETMDRIMLKYLLPAEIAITQVGIYGACYKISIIMTMFIQTFRFAAEPFFFAQAKEKNAKELYADVMKYFMIICSIIFLGTMANISWIQYFVGEEYRVGIRVVPILLIANMCLGATANLAIWYKLTNKTRYGAYLTIFGAIITLSLNYYLIPKIGYIGSAWTTLICYASIMITSYIVGNKHYAVNYDLKRIVGYFSLSLALYFMSKYIELSSTTIELIINNLLLVIFVVVIFIYERKILNRLDKLNV